MRSSLRPFTSVLLLAAAALCLAGCISYAPAPAQPASVIVTPTPSGTVVTPAR
jgi:hypothetical protein